MKKKIASNAKDGSIQITAFKKNRKKMIHQFAGPNDYEGIIYSGVLIVVYLLLLAGSVVFLKFKIPLMIALQQVALVLVTVIVGVTLVRKFRKSLFSFMSVITNTNLIPLTAHNSTLSAAAITTAAIAEQLPDPVSTAAAFGLEVFGGDPNF